MKAFTVYRPNAPESHTAEQKNAPDEPQFQGVVFDDGKVAVRRLTACRSVSVWDSMDDLLKIHGHPEYGTVIVWHEVTEGEKPKPKPKHYRVLRWMQSVADFRVSLYLQSTDNKLYVAAPKGDLRKTFPAGVPKSVTENDIEDIREVEFREFRA